MSLFSVIGDLFSLRKIVSGMSSANAAIGHAEGMEDYYESQARFNAQIGQFNARVARETGEKQVRSMVSQAKEEAIYRVVQAGKSGFEYKEGTSTHLAIRENLSRALQQASEVAFKTEIDVINAEYASLATQMHSQEKAHAAGFQAKAARSDYNDYLFKMAETGAGFLASKTGGSRSLMDITKSDG